MNHALNALASPAAPSVEMPMEQRIHYLDNLRALAMLLGIYLHAALAYANPSQEIWLATDTQSRVWIDVSIWFIHLFRMGLFFLLSGYFSKLLYHRRGVRRFLMQRAVRIMGPFALFYPFLMIALTLVIVFSLSFIEEPRGLMGLIAAAAGESQPEGGTQSSIGTMHLWFLYYLIWFTLLAVILAKQSWLISLRTYWKTPMLFFVPLMFVPVYLYVGNPLPAPESFIPHVWPFFFYGVFFWLGWLLWGNETILDRCSGYRWHLVLLSLILFVPYYLCLPTLDLSALDQETSRTVTWTTLTAAFLGSYLSAVLVLVGLLLGKEYLSQRSGWLSFISDSSYWVYLIHLPVVLFIQTLLIPWTAPAEVKLSLTVVATVIPCWATYLVFVRYTPVGRLLHGKRSFP